MEKSFYIVGGWCRDTLLGNTPKDIDYVAVGYTEKEFASCVSHSGEPFYKRVGKDFPVFLGKDGNEYALARTERSLGDSHTSFSCETANVTLEQDLMRRDLSINSIAYCEATDVFIDPFNGIHDIKTRTLRHTSDAFVEDPLRVLRLARFRAKYGEEFWRINPKTKVLCYELRHSLTTLTKERVWKEVEQVLTYKHSYIFFQTLFELGVLEYVFPNIYQMTTCKEGNKWHTEPSVFEHTMQVMAKCTTPTARLAALYHDIAKPLIYRLYGNGNGHDNPNLFVDLIDLHMPNKYKRDITVLIANHLKIGRLKEMKASTKLAFIDAYANDMELLNQSIELTLADTYGATPHPSVEPYTTTAQSYIFLKRIMNLLKTYSPKKWIESRAVPPTGEQIRAKVFQDRLQIIKGQLWTLEQ